MPVPAKLVSACPSSSFISPAMWATAPFLTLASRLTSVSVEIFRVAWFENTAGMSVCGSNDGSVSVGQRGFWLT